MWTGRLWKQPACWLYIPLFSECLKIWSAFGWEIEKWKIPVLTWPPILKGSQNHEMNIAGWFSVFKELQLTNIPQPSIPQTACKDPHVEYFVLSPSQPPCYLWFWLLSVTKSASRGTVPTGYINILPVTKDCKHMKLTYQYHLLLMLLQDYILQSWVVKLKHYWILQLWMQVELKHNH